MLAATKYLNYAMRLLWVTIIFLASTILPLAMASGTGELSATLSLSVNGQTLHAEVADTDETRRQGLSHRQELAIDAAMLLVFDQPKVSCLWMREVHFALDAAFIDNHGIIIGIAQMHPHTTHLHCSPPDTRYALEVNAGWLRAHQVNLGSLVMGLPKYRPPGDEKL